MDPKVQLELTISAHRRLSLYVSVSVVQSGKAIDKRPGRGRRFGGSKHGRVSRLEQGGQWNRPTPLNTEQGGSD